MIKAKKLVSAIFVVLFMSYYAGLILFSHTHVISGSTIAHSHMHADSHHNTKSGGHTNQEITLIAQISHFDYIDFLCDFVLTSPQLQIQQNKFVETTHWVASIYFQNISLRAPPIV